MCGLFIKARRFLYQRLFCLNTTIWFIAPNLIMDDYAIVTNSSGALDVTRNVDFDFVPKKNVESITMLWPNVTGNALTCHLTRCLVRTMKREVVGKFKEDASG